MKRRIIARTGSSYFRRTLGWGLIVAFITMYCGPMAQAGSELFVESGVPMRTTVSPAAGFQFAAPTQQPSVAMLLSKERTTGAGLPAKSPVAILNGGDPLLSFESRNYAFRSAHESEGGRLWLPTALVVPRLEANAASSGGNDQSSAQGTPKKERRIGKGALALGILGVVGVTAGVVAISESNTNKNCNNSSGSREVCNDVHTLGEVLIPVGAGVAVLGFAFAFRHAR